MLTPEIIAQCQHWVAVNKPSGLVIHKSRGANDRHTLVSVMRAALGPEVYPVNRLDRQTSGVILMARSKEAARELSGAFAQNKVKKTYEALVRGWPFALEPKMAMIERPLDGKPAQTKVELISQTLLELELGRYPETRLALVRLYPTTGIYHQLRRHLKGWGYPIINDSQHGDSKLNAKFFAAFGIKRLLLHSCELSFPFAGSTYSLKANWNGRALGLFDHLKLKPMIGSRA